VQGIALRGTMKLSLQSLQFRYTRLVSSQTDIEPFIGGDVVSLHRTLPMRPAKLHHAGPRAPFSQDAVDPSPLTWKPAWLSVAQLCRRWQLDRRTVYKFIDSGILPAWKVGRHLYRISVAEIFRFEAQHGLTPAELEGTLPNGGGRDLPSRLVSSR
jgi:excisionase family DNA binding protein